MLKLIVNPGTEGVWDFPLPAGVTVLGSDPGLLVPIDHPSVSPAHCEFHVTSAGVTVKDLGSTCGTFINHASVTESLLVPGQTLHLGEVAFQLVSELKSGDVVGEPPLPPRLAPPNPSGLAVVAGETKKRFCKFHPHSLAAWHCEPCASYFCDLCVNIRGAAEKLRHLCRKCGNDCARREIRYERPLEEDFFTALPGAFTYPFRGHGLILLVTGTLFFAVLQFLRSHAGLVGLWLGIFGAGYLFSYTKQIVATTAHGLNDPPDWPDFGSMYEDIVEPFGQMLALVVLAFGPAMIFARWPVFGEDHVLAAVFAALALGSLFAPMGMLALAMFDHVGALNPLALVFSISRIPLPCFVAGAVFEVVLGSYIGAGFLARQMGGFAVLATLPLGFLNLYALTAGMRILGLLYRTNRERLGWF